MPGAESTWTVSGSMTDGISGLFGLLAGRPGPRATSCTARAGRRLSRRASGLRPLPPWPSSPPACLAQAPARAGPGPRRARKAGSDPHAAIEVFTSISALPAALAAAWGIADAQRFGTLRALIIALFSLPPRLPLRPAGASPPTSKRHALAVAPWTSSRSAPRARHARLTDQEQIGLALQAIHAE